MRRKLKWIALMLAGWLLVCLFSGFVLRWHMSLFPRMFGYSRIFGNTPLHWAAEDGRTRAVEKLLAKGAEVNYRNKSGETPLHCAAARGHKKTVELLIAKGADVNSRDDTHISTPLHDAACFGDVEVVKLLIDAGADVNAKLSNGRTPLDCASPFFLDDKEPFRTVFRIFLGIDHDACAKVLLEHGAQGKYHAGFGRPSGITIGCLFPIGGVLICFAAYTWFIVVAFKQDILWGFGCLLMPLVAPVFLMLHWDECKKPLLASAIGAAVCLLGSFLGAALDLL
jgi:hypothetical protein